MIMIVHALHPALTLMTPLQEYCRSFLTKHHLNYFQVLRVYQNGATAYLSTISGYTEWAINYALKRNAPFVYSCVKKNLVNPASYFFLWEENLPTAPVALVRNEFGICNGLTLVERTSTYYDMWGFATPFDNTNAISFYINNLDLLRNFVKYFKEEQKRLIQELESQPLLFPKAQHDVNLSEMLLSPSDTKPRVRIPVIFKNKQSYITPQERECISKLPLGLTTKQIAHILKISPRTVEQYFERVKTRVGCLSKLDLIQLLS